MKYLNYPAKNKAGYLLPLLVFLFTTGILTVVQLKVRNPLILAERFLPGAGWIEIIFMGLYGSFITYKMTDIKEAPRWRIITWSIFSVCFFSQLILGIFLSEKFLMNGKLHLPVPLMILSGPIYRGQLSFMTLLFLSTIVLTGPAWCSQLCYFGAIDGNLAKNKNNRGRLKQKAATRNTGLLVIILFTLLLRFSDLDPLYCTLLGVFFGITGLLVAMLFSRKQGKMIHCLLYCPIGTLVSYLKFINPFRIKINMNCTFCSSCSSVCKYDALTLADLTRKKPGITCTLCGDCLSSCHINSIHYKLFKLSPELSRKIWLFLTLSVHTIFLALARI